MEEELPAVIAEDPQRRAVGGGQGGGGVVSGEGYVRCELDDVEEADGVSSRRAGEQRLDDLIAIEDAAGAAEFLEVLGEERDESGAGLLPPGVEKTLFQGVEMVLQLLSVHGSIIALIWVGWEGEFWARERQPLLAAFLDGAG